MSEAAEKKAPAPRWYIVHAYSGFEEKVAAAIREQAVIQSLDGLVEEVTVPTEDVVEVRRGQKRTVKKKFFPGYVLAKMVLTDDTYHLVNQTPKVTGFLGPQGKPTPITQAEADRILNQVTEGVERPRPQITFEIGEDVKVTDGPFASFNGQVEDIDEETARLKVSVSIFGRATPVELEYAQVEKISK